MYVVGVGCCTSSIVSSLLSFCNASNSITLIESSDRFSDELLSLLREESCGDCCVVGGIDGRRITGESKSMRRGEKVTFSSLIVIIMFVDVDEELGRIIVDKLDVGEFDLVSVAGEMRSMACLSVDFRVDGDGVAM